MFYALGLFLLLSPFPSFQTPTEKRDTAGTNFTKVDTVLTLSKPKTTETHSKQNEHPTLKPNTVNVTVLPTPASNHRYPAPTTPATAAKIKHSPAVVQTTPSKAVKVITSTGTNTNRDKQKVNQTDSAKLLPLGRVKVAKDKPATTGAPNVQSTTTKLPSDKSFKNPKNKPQLSANNTTPVKTPTNSDAHVAKDKSVQDLPSSPDNKNKTTKSKPNLNVSVNETVVANPSITNVKKDKPAPPNVQITKRVDSAKDESTASTNRTNERQTPITVVKQTPAQSQPVKVIINNDCDSSQTRDRELSLTPGAPLVMTHKISLLPGGCTGGCEAEMAALKGRVARLEREMSFLKDKCPCSANCPNHCSGNGQCEKGKCVCRQGFIGTDCSKCARDADCNQKDDAKKGTHTSTKNVGVTPEENPETSGKNSIVKDSLKPAKTDNPTSGQKNTKNDKIEPEGTKKSFPTTDKKHEPLKDEPQSNTTISRNKKKSVSFPGERQKGEKTKETTEQSTLNKNNTQLLGTPTKTDKKGKPQTSKDNDVHRFKKNENGTTPETTHKVSENKTVPGTGSRASGGLGSIKIVNVSSSSFTVTWLAPQGMFKNFTVVLREPQTESAKDDHEAISENTREKRPGPRNSTEVQREGTNTTASSGKTPKDKPEPKRFSRVLSGSERSVLFKDLRANTPYVVNVYGSTAHRRSKIHRVTANTGPEPPKELIFNNVTEASLAVSWTKPKTPVTGFRVTYTNIAKGISRFVPVSSQQSHVFLSELSAGSSYVISVTSTKGQAQSDELTSTITTVPAPPTHIQVLNVTDNKAVLQWTPSPGKIDRFIVSYASSKTPNVTVTVMLSGNSAQYQLKGLQRGTLYKVKVRSQKGSLQSTVSSTTFTTANVVKASEVGPRSAVIVWKSPVIYNSYRITYQVEGDKTKEVILEPTVTEYKLTRLMPSSKYFVVVQGEKNGQHTSVVTSQFITGKLRFPFPNECSQELLNGALESGEVDIFPEGKEGPAVRVYCDMETDGGGWTVFQRRMSGKTDFYRTWSDYKAGFGNLSEEFWLGNELLHNLTSMGPMSLRVDLRSGNDSAHAHYSNFSIASEEKNYALTVSGFTGTAGDSMRYHNGRPFSARDKDPDSLGIHCAKAYMGGWWYKNCYKVNLNGLYGINTNNQGIVWIDWKGKDSSIPFSEMKFRPSRFSPTTYG